MSRIQSMTGFASVQVSTRTASLNMELRSVNSRFLDIQFRMPDDLRIVEPLIRETLVGRLGRGKVECRLNWVRDNSQASIPTLQVDVIKSLSQLEQSIKQWLPQAEGFRVSEILNWPGTVEDNSLSTDELKAAVSALTEEACVALVDSREREGGRLNEILLDKLTQMTQIISELEPHLPSFIQHYENKLIERVTDLFNRGLEGQHQLVSKDELFDRVRQEVTIHGMRIDVAEEMERLRTHFKEAQHILKKGGAVGKRLDFLMQELNREANTLGSKASAIEQTKASLELKLLIEQMREQVQNLE